MKYQRVKRLQGFFTRRVYTHYKEYGMDELFNFYRTMYGRRMTPNPHNACLMYNSFVTMAIIKSIIRILIIVYWTQSPNIMPIIHPNVASVHYRHSIFH